MALDLRVPVIAMAQVGRPEEKKKAVMPTLSSLRESGNIEQDADTAPSKKLPWWE